MAQKDKELNIEEIVHVICALAHDDGLKPNKQFVMEISGLKRISSTDKDLGDYKVIVQRLR